VNRRAKELKASLDTDGDGEVSVHEMVSAGRRRAMAQAIQQRPLSKLPAAPM